MPVPASTPVPARAAAAARPVDRTAVRRGRALTVLAAAAGALVVWTVAGPMLGVDFLVRPIGAPGTQQVGPVAVAATGIGIGLAGWAMLALLERFTSRARLAWTVIAAVALVLSLGSPFAGLEAATVVALECLHLTVGGIILLGLRRTARRS